jgi:hypothetical protein
VFYDSDCAPDYNGCGLDASGEAWCTNKCPSDVTPLGRCDGSVVQKCDGQTYATYDCAKYDAFCDPTATHYGAGCRRWSCAPGVTMEGACQADGSLLYCADLGITYQLDCSALGGACGWNPDRCQNECLNTIPLRSCDDEGLKEGQQRCKKDLYYGFWSIWTCVNGSIVTAECPPAGQGNEGCDDSVQPAACTLPLCQGNAVRYCSDIGSLVECDATTWTWTDCHFFGGTCVDDGKDQYCACTSLLESPMPCSGKDAQGNPYRFACVNGRISKDACVCQAPQ